MSAMTRRAAGSQESSFPYVSDADLRKLRAWAEHRSQTRDLSVTEDADRVARRVATSAVYQADVALGIRRARPGWSRRQARERCVELTTRYDVELRQYTQPQPDPALATLAHATPSDLPAVSFAQLTEEQLRGVRRWIWDRMRRQVATTTERIVHDACLQLLNPATDFLADLVQQQALHARVLAYVDHAQVPGIDLELPVPATLRDQIWRCVAIATQRQDDVLLKQCVAALGGGQMGARSRAIVIATLRKIDNPPAKQGTE